MKTRILTAIALSLALTLTARAQVPGIINYQGRIVDNGTNFNGTGQFKFALVSSNATVSYWSNDGTSVGGSQPTTNVSLTVTKGLYSVLLGDTTIPHMTVVPAAVFANSNVLLRVWFSDGTGFQQLSPDQRIAAAGYAMQAQNAYTAAFANSLASSSTGTVYGQSLDIGTNNTVASGVYASIAGGQGNSIQNSSPLSIINGGNFIGGGDDNTIQFNAAASTIAGGILNTIQTNVQYSFIGGGDNNVIDGNAQYATVAGGLGNVAYGFYSTVPGGSDNTASGNWSFAAGDQAQALHQGAFVWADTSGGVFASTANNQFLIRAVGGVGIGTANPKTQLEVNGNYVLIDGTNAADGAGLIDAYIGGNGSGSDVQVGSMNSNITAVGFWNSTAGAWMHISCSSITIHGGSDLAEPFPISGADNEVPQGSVVVIDDEHPGRLKMSAQPYDTRVAGVVSGANGVKPGIQMQQQELLGGGKNVALSGRVYVQADASYGPIKPGDLLTTSATPGHAMKVTDHAKAQGAILGKAMTGLNEGRGFVLVLVTLQ